MLFYVRVDEIFLKGGNQKMFFGVLCENLKKLLSPTLVKRTEGGLLLDIDEQKVKQLSLIPGIAKFSQTNICKNDLGSIVKIGEKMLKDFTGKTFAIDTNRSYKKFPLKSQEVNEKVGGELAEKFNLKVNLKNPDLKISIFITKEETYVCGKHEEGIGGLPTGTSGKVMCLLSGGIDSPVASYLMMKRGAQVDLIHFQNETKLTEEVSQKIFDIARTLSFYQPKIKLHIVLFKDWQKQIVMKVPADYRMIITRRLMFRIAERVAKKQKCLALCTGDSLGQVASQTLENLSAVYVVSSMLKLNPLSGTNKMEIMRLANKIGTLEISNRPYEDCCSLFVSAHPQTRAKLSDVEKMEKALDLSALDKTDIISYNISMR